MIWSLVSGEVAFCVSAMGKNKYNHEITLGSYSNQKATNLCIVSVLAYRESKVRSDHMLSIIQNGII